VGVDYRISVMSATFRHIKRSGVAVFGVVNVFFSEFRTNPLKSDSHKLVSVHFRLTIFLVV